MISMNHIYKDPGIMKGILICLKLMNLDTFFESCQ